MATLGELWDVAHDLYARARSCFDPLLRQKLMRAADDYMNQAEEIRRNQFVMKAEYPKSSSVERPPNPG